MSHRIAFACAALSCAFSLPAAGTQPPREGGPLPSALRDRLIENPRFFTYKRALTGMAERAQMVRSISRNVSVISDVNEHREIAKAIGAATRVEGRRAVPVLLGLYANSAAQPWQPAQLQRQLFDGPWPSGTMADYYKEVSGGALTVQGTVYPWVRTSGVDTAYEGADYIDDQTNLPARCFGVCPNARLDRFLKELIEKNGAIDWAQYDNDGPDGIPNSGDDDGFVDFIAFVHPERGGECQDNRNVWSHRSSLSSWSEAYETKSPRKGGGFITIDDYVIMPAIACSGNGMTPIGVFAHEFGHAFGLPDLYDTSHRSAGLGVWCLMSGGSWGGDGNSPERPTHMSPWAKAFLGWVDQERIDADRANHSVPEIHDTRRVYRIEISNTQYYLVSFLKRKGFDLKLPSDGLQVWKINESVVQAGLRSNKVNYDPNNRGVELVEASDLRQLHNRGYIGSPADLFPGSHKRTAFDTASSPRSLSRTSVCAISDPAASLTASFFVSRNQCALASGPIPAFPAVGTMGAPPAPSASPPAPAGLAPGQTVEVKGLLTNVGSNYFDRKSRRIVLIDGAGREIDVAAQLPMELPAPTGSRPATLSDFLDRTVTVQGTVIGGEAGAAPRVRVQKIQRID